MRTHVKSALAFPGARESNPALACLTRPHLWFFHVSVRSRRSRQVIWFREGSRKEGDRTVAWYKLEWELGLSSGFTEIYSSRSPWVVHWENSKQHAKSGVDKHASRPGPAVVSSSDFYCRSRKKYLRLAESRTLGACGGGRDSCRHGRRARVPLTEI